MTKKRARLIQAGPLCFPQPGRFKVGFQVTDLKQEIICFEAGSRRENQVRRRRTLVKLWREYGRDRVTISKEA
jgi:hypothetical protein